MKEVIFILTSGLLVLLIQCKTKFSFEEKPGLKRDDTALVNEYLRRGLQFRFANTDSATYYYRQALMLSRQIGDMRGQVWSTMQLGNVLENAGRREEAISLLNQAKELARQYRYKDDDFQTALLLSFFDLYKIRTPDSGLHYSRELYKLGVTTKNKNIEALGLSSESYCHYLTGAYPLALDQKLKALEIFEEIKSDRPLVDLYFELGLLYKALEDFSKALKYFDESRKYSEMFDDSINLQFVKMHIGDCYYYLDSVDYAKKYALEAYEMSKRNDYNKYKSVIYRTLARIHQHSNEAENALQYYRMAINHDVIQESKYLLSGDYISFGHFFLSRNNLDSAMHYAILGLDLAREESLLRNEKDAYKLLSQVYEKKNLVDSAFKYQKIAVQTNDSLFTQGGKLQIEALSFRESQRILQKAAEEERQKDQRNKFVFFFVILISLCGIFSYLIVKRRNLIREKQRLKKKFDQELLKTQLEIQEATFQNISQEIHDNIGQTLSLVKLNMHEIDEELDVPPQNRLTESTELLSQAIRDLRDLSRSLNTTFISEIGLESAISQQLAILQKTGSYTTELNTSGDPYKIPPDHQLMLFRIVQELLHNIVKHAEATRIVVTMNYEPDRIKIAVEDDGKGFDVEQTIINNSNSLGIRNMRNRVNLLNGSLQFLKRDKGTCVVVELPLQVVAS